LLAPKSQLLAPHHRRHRCRLFLLGDHLHPFMWLDLTEDQINNGVTFMNASRGAVQWRLPIGFHSSRRILDHPASPAQGVPRTPNLFPTITLADVMQRWLATKHKEDEALADLAWIRKVPQDDPIVQFESAESSPRSAKRKPQQRALPRGRSSQRGTRFASASPLLSSLYNNGASELDLILRPHYLQIDRAYW